MKIPGWFIIVCASCCLVVAAPMLAAWLAWDVRIAMLIMLVVAYVVLASIYEFLQYRLRRRLDRMDPGEKEVLAGSEPLVRYARSAPGAASPRMTVLAGVLAINGLALPIMLGPLALLQQGLAIRDPLASVLCLLLGFVLAWGWWSVGVTAWRWWASERRGMPPAEAQWRGEQACLLWPKNHFFERTEFGRLAARRRAR